MAVELDIEQPGALLAYLRDTARLGADEAPSITVLEGGVSNRTLLVERSGGISWVIKQALPRLRVATEWNSEPARIEREGMALRCLPGLLPLGCTPRFVFEDPRHHLLAMEAVPQPHVNWKTCLLRGQVDPGLVRCFAEMLGRLHGLGRGATAAKTFDDRSFFESLRLDPYYRFTAARQPAAQDFMDQLIRDTLATRLSLVHGDYSPKNALVREGRLVLLDFEVIHFGDPAFDVGFALTHLLSKAHHLPQHRGAFLEAARLFWATYIESLGLTRAGAGLEHRAVRHTLGCLLARVCGRSPLEYLTQSQQDWQRAQVLRLMQEAPGDLESLLAQWAEGLRGKDHDVHD